MLSTYLSNNAPLILDRTILTEHMKAQADETRSSTGRVRDCLCHGIYSTNIDG